ncbi:hypothetical protein Pyn_39859 [Prunus yedoensis var. nudiflora]|uniref:Uncharacterized protein n=1 Tax=Prunus yedoensis var. nudiflora TaxID=2094558 RepID=A0A314Y5P4_PRUYE|nr:hypothetical protein Pyn_39859 [Prunus yedoensis var. nudiflora]
MESQVEAACQGELKEEVCALELPASDVDSEIESSEIVQPMMTLVSCPLVESTFNKGAKGVTDQLEFLKFIDSTGFRGKAEDESICLHIDSNFPKCYYNSNSPESSSSHPGRIDEDMFVKPIRVYKRKRWKRKSFNLVFKSGYFLVYNLFLTCSLSFPDFSMISKFPILFRF